MDIEPVQNLQAFFKDYPSMLKGLKKLAIKSPTDLQLQLLQCELSLDNLLLTAPAESGKTLALVLIALKRFFNDEEGILIFLIHSKELSQALMHMLTTLAKLPIVNLFMQSHTPVEGKQIVVGSPFQINSLDKQVKDLVTQVVIVQVDFMLSFGYGDSLNILAGSLPPKISYKLSCIQRNSEIDAFKSKAMTKVVKIDYQPPTKPQNTQAPQQVQVTHFYQVGDKVILPISLYVTLKFRLVNPKILILCENLREVYRTQLLLNRCRIPKTDIYNNENPTNLKFYTLSIWMNDNTDILIATKQIFDDLSSNIFHENCRKNYKRQKFQLVNMTTVICLNLYHLASHFAQIYFAFQSKPFLLTFLENKQKQIQALQTMLSYEKQNFTTVVSKNLPITRNELQGFRYRINDVFTSLGNSKVALLQQLDFKKKMLRSPDMKQYFSQNEKEREVLIKSINQIRVKLDKDKISVSDLVPEYLVPACLKTTYLQNIKAIQKDAENEPTPEYHKKVQRVLKYIDKEEEDPEITEVSRLKLISARKRWKLQHGFKLNKRNMRNEKKGIFEVN